MGLTFGVCLVTWLSNCLSIRFTVWLMFTCLACLLVWCLRLVYVVYVWGWWSVFGVCVRCLASGDLDVFWLTFIDLVVCLTVCLFVYLFEPRWMLTPLFCLSVWCMRFAFGYWRLVIGVLFEYWWLVIWMSFWLTLIVLVFCLAVCLLVYSTDVHLFDVCVWCLVVCLSVYLTDLYLFGCQSVCLVVRMSACCFNPGSCDPSNESQHLDAAWSVVCLIAHSVNACAADRWNSIDRIRKRRNLDDFRIYYSR